MGIGPSILAIRSRMAVGFFMAMKIHRSASIVATVLPPGSGLSKNFVSASNRRSSSVIGLRLLPLIAPPVRGFPFWNFVVGLGLPTAQNHPVFVGARGNLSTRAQP